MSISLTELRQLKFADAMYEALFPCRDQPRGHTEYAYQYLWKKIVNLELRPGDRVLDAAIAAEAGVSRTPVREAIQRLVQDGLLQELPRGVCVARLTAADVVHLFDYRIAIETFAARQAALVVAEAEVERLLGEGRSIRARLRAPGGRHDPQVAVDFLCHSAGLHRLLYSAGNPYLAHGMAMVQARLVAPEVAGSRVPGRMEQGMAEHEAILHALLGRDPVGASTAVEVHLQCVKGRTLAHSFGVRVSDRVSAGTGLEREPDEAEGGRHEQDVLIGALRHAQ